jgi:hypothetical protein
VKRKTIMKFHLLTVLVFSGLFLVANGELTKDQLKQLEDMEIDGVHLGEIRDDDRNKIIDVEINTTQNDSDDAQGGDFRMRVVLELKDADKNMYLADFTGDRPGDIDTEYTGEDYWHIYLPHGDLKRPKVERYAIQFGFMDGETFIVFAEDYQRVKTLEELTESGVPPYPDTIRMKHYYMYDDIELGETESISRTVRQIKTNTGSGMTTEIYDD